MTPLSSPATKTSTADRRTAMLRSALGPVIGSALNNPNVIEILVNPDGAVWIEHADKGRIKQDNVLEGAVTERIIRLVASHIGIECDNDHPVVSGELPGSLERFEGLLPPVVTAPSIAIRKPIGRNITLSEYVDAGIMDADQAALLNNAVRQRKNIVIAGGTSSGKTTLANALLGEIADCEERIVILEDTRELNCGARDLVALRTSKSIGLADLVRSTMRLRPDRIIVGEVRGGEALDLLKAWNTGHPGGVATVHANSARAALSRIEQLVSERARTIPRDLIGEVVDLVVFITRTKDGRRVQDIIHVDGWRSESGYQIRSAEQPGNSTAVLKPTNSSREAMNGAH